VYVFTNDLNKKGNVALFSRDLSANLVVLHRLWLRIWSKPSSNPHPRVYNFTMVLTFMFVHSGWPQLVSMKGWDSSEMDVGK